MAARRAVTVLVVLVALCGCGGSKFDKAKSQCHAAVAAKLKSPGTATFQPNVDGMVKLTSGRWAMDGTVDSQNSFGATLRSTYLCSEQADGSVDAVLIGS